MNNLQISLGWQVNYPINKANNYPLALDLRNYFPYGNEPPPCADRGWGCMVGRWIQQSSAEQSFVEAPRWVNGRRPVITLLLSWSMRVIQYQRVERAWVCVCDVMLFCFTRLTRHSKFSPSLPPSNVLRSSTLNGHVHLIQLGVCKHIAWDMTKAFCSTKWLLCGPICH